MKPFLLYAIQDFDWVQPEPWNEKALTQDLDLAAILDAMSKGDPHLRDIAARVILTGLDDPAEIRYRQDVLRDCLAHPSVIRELYDFILETVAGEKKIHTFAFMRSSSAILGRSIKVLEFMQERLRALRIVAESNAEVFFSAGFQALFHTLTEELGEEYLKAVSDHLTRLRFRYGVLLSAQLGVGNHGRDYVLRDPGPDPSRWKRFTQDFFTPAHTLVIDDRDEAGAQALAELKDRGINQAANALAQSTGHVVSFFRMLAAELGFYIGCVNLHEKLSSKQTEFCFPVPEPVGQMDLTTEGLCDASLMLRLGHRVVGNDIHASGKHLVVITGANQGGKSTLLRGIGLALLMMQSGMFVTATYFRANLSTGIFTHYKREEDTTMTSGKLDEELGRMSGIVDHLRPGGTVLFNESFAATNEREGSEIARQIVQALTDSSIRVFLVTHLFDLASGLREEHPDTALFLRADRQDDGHRTFRIIEGAPLPTSYGIDLYNEVFTPHAAGAPSALLTGA
ncbi:MAG: DNA mismatch repair protein MutS [Nakamurella sp.]